MMSGIHGKDTKPEILVRRYLHRLGFRFRLHDPKLPGKPDLVLPKYKTVIFVHGCFWHRHQGCKFSSTPKSNTDFWLAKLNGNVARDLVVEEKIKTIGWHRIVIWECEVGDQTHLADIAKQLRDTN